MSGTLLGVYLGGGRAIEFKGSEGQVAVWPVLLARQWAGQPGNPKFVSLNSTWNGFSCQASLVSHKVNLKVTTEWQRQEKYCKALCTYLSGIRLYFPLPPQLSTCLGIDQDARASPSIKYIKHGRSMTLMWKKDGEEKAYDEWEVRCPVRSWAYCSSTSSMPLCLADCFFDCFCSWILFSQLCPSLPSLSLLVYPSSSTTGSDDGQWGRACTGPSDALSAQGTSHTLVTPFPYLVDGTVFISRVTENSALPEREYSPVGETQRVGKTWANPEGGTRWHWMKASNTNKKVVILCSGNPLLLPCCPI